MLDEPRRLLLFQVLLLLSLFSLGIFFFFDLSNQLVLWFSVAVSSMSVGMILARQGHERTRMFALLLFASMYHVAPLLRAREGGIPYRVIYSTDEAYQEQLNSLVFENGVWQPGIGTGLAFSYSFYPIIAILSVIATNVIGQNPSLSHFVNIAFPTATAILPLIFYVGSMKTFTGRTDWALWSGYIFSLNEQFMLFDSTFSYESVGIVFFTLILYLVARRPSGAGKLALIPMLVALTLSHFWTNLNLVLFLTIFYMLPRVISCLSRRVRSLTPSSDHRVFEPSLSLTLAALSLLAVYTTLVATISAAKYALLIPLMLASETRLAPKTTFRSDPEILLIILGQIVLVAFGSLGFFARKKGPSPFLKLVFLLGGIYLVIMLFGLPSSFARPILHRAFVFSFFVIAPLVAWTVHSSTTAYTRQIKALLLVFTMLSVVLMQDPWFRYPDFMAPDSQIYAGRWARYNLGFGSVFVSMRSVSHTFGAYGRMSDLDLEPFYVNRTLIETGILEGNIFNLLIRYDGHYMVISSSTNDWLLRYFIERYSLKPGGKYVEAALHYYSSDAHFNRILNSGYISSYCVTC